MTEESHDSTAPEKAWLKHAAVPLPRSLCRSFVQSEESEALCNVLICGSLHEQKPRPARFPELLKMPEAWWGEGTACSARSASHLGKGSRDGQTGEQGKRQAETRLWKAPCKPSERDVADSE
ncbi:hypothetical protein P7K49_014980 [Saguinus oedipus]|uniref:Uncharacterized protein n=1 Tax=Saguinus oedipus TaxID=9490 RepID=A0ABQ9V888_SAGOE|nr:hypothetical protein P7K49_014980 [Saguinus oedipus]